MIECKPGDWDHKFEARYDEKVSEVFGALMRDPPPRDKIYVHDICIKCGHTIVRSKK